MNIVKYRIVAFEIDVFKTKRWFEREIVAPPALIAEFDDIQHARLSLEKCYRCSVIPYTRIWWNAIKYQIEKTYNLWTRREWPRDINKRTHRSSKMG